MYLPETPGNHQVNGLPQRLFGGKPKNIFSRLVIERDAHVGISRYDGLIANMPANRAWDARKEISTRFRSAISAFCFWTICAITTSRRLALRPQNKVTRGRLERISPIASGLDQVFKRHV